MRQVSRWVALATALSLSVPGLAQADGPPDIVRLKNGGMLRGTIEELAPGQKVVILLPSGERRTILAADFDYAGSSDKEPKTAPPPASSAPPASKAPPSTGEVTVGDGKTDAMAVVKTRESEIEFVGSEGMTVFMKTGEAFSSSGQSAVGFSRLCTLPCSVKLGAGSYQLGVGKESPSAFTSITVPAGRSRVQVSYVDKSGARKTVLVVAGGAFLLGTIIVLSTIGATDSKGRPTTPDSFWLGLGLMSLSPLVFVGLRPGDAVEMKQARTRLFPTLLARDGERAPRMPGLSFTGRF